MRKTQQKSDGDELKKWIFLAYIVSRLVASYNWHHWYSIDIHLDDVSIRDKAVNACVETIEDNASKDNITLTEQDKTEILNIIEIYLNNLLE